MKTCIYILTVVLTIIASLLIMSEGVDGGPTVWNLVGVLLAGIAVFGWRVVMADPNIKKWMED